MATILFLLPTYADPPTSGQTTRYYHIHTALRNLGHDIRMHVSDRQQSPDIPPRPLSSRLLRPVRLMRPADWTSMSDLLRSDRPDLVIASHESHSDITLLAHTLGVPVILETQNFEAGLQMMRSRGRGIREQLTVLLSESIYFRSADRIWTVCEEDRRAYQRTYHLRSVSVVPPVVPLPPVAEDPATGQIEILFVGSYSYAPNLTAARFLVAEVMPILRRELDSRVRLTLAGRAPPGWLRSCSCDEVEITGGVPDLAPYYRRAMVVVSPVQEGGGVKTKVLEAMAHGKPVVVTGGSARGIEVVEGRHLVMTPFDPGQFASALLTVARDDQLQRRLGEAARELIASRYSAERLEDVLEREIGTTLESSGPWRVRR